MSDNTTFSSRAEAPIDSPPWRVVSLVPALTESLYDLDLGDRLIGISDYCVPPQTGVKSWVKVGGTHNPDTTRIIGLQPDVVLMDSEKNRPDDAEALRAANIPVWVMGPRTVFETLNLLWDIMNVFDHAVMVPRVREIERAYDYTQAAANTSEQVRVFAAIGHNPWLTFNGDTYPHDVLCVCGGNNIFAGHTERYPAVTPDDIEPVQPDVILLPDDCPEPESRVFEGLDVPAAHNRRIHRIDPRLLTWYGTRVAFALRDLPLVLVGSGKP
jgi:ABC-type Fe3+-hydroxamate transport system substrate-binding protein